METPVVSGTLQSRRAHPSIALRAVREKLGWSLADVTRRTGIPTYTLSKIENHRASLNFDKLSRLSVGMGVDIADFFRPPREAPAPSLNGRRSATRAGEGALVETAAFRHRHHAADLLNKAMTPVVCEVRARTLEASGGLVSLAGERFAYVLAGAAAMHTEVYAPLALQVGDSVFFDGVMAHAFVAISEGPCRMLVVSAAGLDAGCEGVSD